MKQNILAGHLDGIPLLRVDGDLDRVTGAKLVHWGEEASGGGNRLLLLDLSGCQYVDSGGLGSLFSLLELLTPRGVAVAFGTSPDVERLLETVGLLRTPAFRIYFDEAAVRAALASEGLAPGS